MPVLFIMTTLKPGVDPDEYQAWLLKHDRPFALSHPNFKSYNVHHVSGPIEGVAGTNWEYVERLELGSLEQHARDLASPEGKALIDEIERRFVDASKTISFASDIVA
jgi:hypothetical protein